MAAFRLRFPIVPAVLTGSLALAISGCSDDDSKAKPDGGTVSGSPDATAPGQVQHLPTFTPPDAYAGGEREVRATLELDASGCLTLDGNLVALPEGSEVTADESIGLPDGKILRWWVPTTMYTYPTQPRKGTVNQRDPVPGLDACTADALAPLTLVTSLRD